MNKCVVNNKLLNTQFDHVARNTIDYWMTEPQEGITEQILRNKIQSIEITPNSSLQLYLHVPYCTQKCTFCAFNGGNHTTNKEAKRYSALLIKQVNNMLLMSGAHEKTIRSIHIGGGSPDLLGPYIGDVLDYVSNLTGYNKDSTEISVELALQTAKQPFVDALKSFPVTKASFGIQTFDPKVRKHVSLAPIKSTMRQLDWFVGEIEGSIPIINADLMTGLPGQNMEIIDNDLQTLIAHPSINAVSSYLFTPGAAPLLVADVHNNKIPELPSQDKQAMYRLHSYSLLQKSGYQRFGTNTYIDKKAPKDALQKISGNECIGAFNPNDLLLGCGAQAIGSLPGVRLENVVNVDKWMDSIESGGLGFNLPDCAIDNQTDMPLWTFPLNHNGLCKEKMKEMISNNIINESQKITFQQYLEQGLIHDTGNHYELTILGEVFMGHLVSGLKKEKYKKVIDKYIEQGYQIAENISANKLKKVAKSNNRQIAFTEV